MCVRPFMHGDVGESSSRKKGCSRGHTRGGGWWAVQLVVVVVLVGVEGRGSSLILRWCTIDLLFIAWLF